MTTNNEKSGDGYIEQLSQIQVDDDNKREFDLDQARHLQESYVPDTPEEKALVRKLDWRLVVSTGSTMECVSTLTVCSPAAGPSTS